MWVVVLQFLHHFLPRSDFVYDAVTTALHHIKVSSAGGNSLYQVCRKDINIVDIVTNELMQHISLS